MTPPNTDFQTFYDARAHGHRQLHDRDIVWDRYTQPSVVASALLLVLTILYQFYGPRIAPQGVVVSFTDFAWDLLVHAVPTRLVELLDQRNNPPSLSPMTTANRPAQDHAAKSEAMRRVLGLDRPGGVMASVLQVRSRALSSTGSALGFKVDVQRPPGLGNRDNSCYQNSILQGLASLEPFPEYLSKCLGNIDVQGGNRDVTHTLQTLISDLNDTSNNGKTLWTPSVLKSMSTWTQQDAQEYYSKILDDIDKAIARAIKASRQHSGLREDPGKNRTAANSDDGDSELSTAAANSRDLRNPLEGLLAQRVACVACGYSEGLSMIPFNCLTLSLGLDKSFYDLHDRMNAYTRLELIEGVECPRCTLLKAKRLLTRLVDMMQEKGSSEQQLKEPTQRLEAVDLVLEEDLFDDKTMQDKCKISNQAKVTTTKTKQIVIARPPQSLAIHMNRSVFDPATFDMMKNSAPVRFPKILDLGPWCLGSADISNAELSHDDKSGQELWQVGPEVSMVAGDVRSSRVSGPLYELKAAVTHYGRHENGHYICYRKFPRNAQPPPPLKGEKTGGSRPVDGADEGNENEKIMAGSDAGSDDEEMDWWRLSDHNVTKVDEETVLSLSPGVFMLFYDCVDPTMAYQEHIQSIRLDEKQNAMEPAAKSARIDEPTSKETNGHAIRPGAIPASAAVDPAHISTLPNGALDPDSSNIEAKVLSSNANDMRQTNGHNHKSGQSS